LRNIVFVGPHGVGKSFMGRALSQMLHYCFVDLDQLIEQYVGRDRRDIVSYFGISTFRSIETQLLKNLCTLSRTVIALGGGSCLCEENRFWIGRLGSVIYFHIEKDDLLHRWMRNNYWPLACPKRDFFDLYYHDRVSTCRELNCIEVQVDNAFLFSVHHIQEIIMDHFLA